MTKKIYNKLVRDKIPEIISGNKGVATTTVLGQNQYEIALRKKVIEEAQELVEAKGKLDVLNELADVLQLVESISASNGISMEEVSKAKDVKKEKRGAFKKRIFLESVEE